MRCTAILKHKEKGHFNLNTQPTEHRKVRNSYCIKHRTGFCLSGVVSDSDFWASSANSYDQRTSCSVTAIPSPLRRGRMRRSSCPHPQLRGPAQVTSYCGGSGCIIVIYGPSESGVILPAQSPDLFTTHVQKHVVFDTQVIKTLGPYYWQ